MGGPVERDVDSSMQLLSIMGQHLVARETALEVAKLLLRDNYGQAELDSQLPLTITDGGDCWMIRGCKRRNMRAATPANDVREADFVITITKSDCRVLKLAFEGALTPLDRHGRPISE